MNKLNSKFFEYLKAHPCFGPVTPLSHNRYKVSCRTCEESFNNPRVHVLKKHLESAKHAARKAVRSGVGLTKKETVQRDKLLLLFPFLRFIAPYLVCSYCELVFSCGASPSMIANHEKCRKHQDLKAEYQLKYSKLQALQSLHSAHHHHQHQQTLAENDHDQQLMMMKAAANLVYAAAAASAAAAAASAQPIDVKMEEDESEMGSEISDQEVSEHEGKEHLLQRRPGVIFFSTKDGRIVNLSEML